MQIHLLGASKAPPIQSSIFRFYYNITVFYPSALGSGSNLVQIQLATTKSHNSTACKYLFAARDIQCKATTSTLRYQSIPITHGWSWYCTGVSQTAVRDAGNYMRQVRQALGQFPGYDA